MFTREDYLNRKCTHREYYAQFVTAETRDTVKRAIGLKKLLASTDEHLNDIPLQLWDKLHGTVPRRTWLKLQNEAKDISPVSLSNSVCIHKEAARQVIEQHVVARAG